jgi:hypothetical protein
VWHSNFASQGCNIDDRAITTRHHLGQDGKRTVNGGQEIRIHRVAEDFIGLLLQRRDRDNPGVIDKDVDPAEGLCRAVDQ